MIENLEGSKSNEKSEKDKESSANANEKAICNWHEATEDGIREAFLEVEKKEKELVKDKEGVIFLTDEVTAIELEAQSRQNIGRSNISNFELSEAIVIKPIIDSDDGTKETNTDTAISNLKTYLSSGIGELHKSRTLVLAFPGDDVLKCVQKSLDELNWKKYAVLNSRNFTNKVKAKSNNSKALDSPYHKVMQEELDKAFKIDEIRESIGEMSREKLYQFIYNIALTPLDPINTGFKNLDEALGCGGLIRGRLYAIGAMSSLGKTTFALNIADNVASCGKDVLIFSLEMSTKELRTKSISRIMRKLNPTPAKTAIEIYELAKNEGKWGKETRDIFNKAVNEYGGWVKHSRIIEGMGDMGVQQIRNSLDDLQRIGCLPGLVIIDYLQILHPYNEKFNDKQNIDKNIMELKRISRDFNIVVIVISSFNRSNYLTEVSFESFKESGSIEYSCDVLMGLQLKVQEGDSEISNEEKSKKREAINEAKLAEPRKIQLVILKNRMYKAWTKIDFDYHTRYEWFEESKNQNQGNGNKDAPQKPQNKFHEGQSGIGEIS